MRTLVISDVHGRSNWLKYVNTLTWDQVVFLGDYFDSFDISGVDQIENFRIISKFKGEFRDKVTLLCGNHDLHYLIDHQEYTGYQPIFASRFLELLRPLQSKDALVACKIVGKYLLSHAGVTLTWCHDWDVSHQSLENDINDLFKYKPLAFCFQPGYDPQGDNVFQSPMWVRPKSLKNDQLLDYTHIVGHTVKKEIIQDNGVWFTDVMGTSDQVLMIEDNKISVIKYER